MAIGKVKIHVLIRHMSCDSVELLVGDAARVILLKNFRKLTLFKAAFQQSGGGVMVITEQECTHGVIMLNQERHHAIAESGNSVFQKCNTIMWAWGLQELRRERRAFSFERGYDFVKLRPDAGTVERGESFFIGCYQ